MKKSRKWLAMGLAFSMIAGLTGCGGSSSASKSVSAGSKGDMEVKTFRVLMYTDWYKAGWQALEQHINENSKELGFKLEISKIQGGSQGDQVLQTKFATDDLPDIIQVYKPQWVESYANGLDKLVDLTGLECVSEYDEKALDGTFKYNGKLYAVPIDSVVLSGVFYNKKVFEKAGVKIPQTWDELLAVCEKVKAQGVTPVYYSGKDAWSVQPPTISGLLNDAKEKGTDTFGLMEQINTNKLKYADCTNFVGSIEKTKNLIDLGYMNETYLSDTVDNAHQALANGECAMYINGTWCADNINKKFPDKIDDIGAFAIPTTSGDNYINMFTPYSLALTTNCKNPELGKKVLNYIASKEAQQIYADAQPGVYLNKNVTSDIPKATEDLKKIMDSGKSMTDWEEINKYAYGNLSEPLLNYYTGMLKDAKEVAQALDQETARNAKAQGDSNWK
ncbi:ABC transporter substrate-binding protein [Lacrimispora sp.]|uniref:ABC transporter substrate-binding protein n=1 Tax=Lacrimispora sp. TaxID=2719234 RepID=UPI0028A87A1C|nr:extracellular solute-binding protein [Lacrimispora sp.]